MLILITIVEHTGLQVFALGFVAVHFFVEKSLTVESCVLEIII